MVLTRKIKKQYCSKCNSAQTYVTYDSRICRYCGHKEKLIELKKGE